MRKKKSNHDIHEMKRNMENLPISQRGTLLSNDPLRRREVCRINECG